MLGSVAVFVPVCRFNPILISTTTRSIYCSISFISWREQSPRFECIRAETGQVSTPWPSHYFTGLLLVRSGRLRVLLRVDRLVANRNNLSGLIMAIALVITITAGQQALFYDPRTYVVGTLGGVVGMVGAFALISINKPMFSLVLC